jgi:hypothetical protein
MNLTFSTTTSSQVEVVLLFAAGTPDQDTTVVIADVCFSCTFVSVLETQTQYKFHQQFQHHTAISCNTILCG